MLSESWLEKLCPYFSTSTNLNDSFTCRLWRRGQFCPECNRCFGREVKESQKKYWNCWVCSRQHHSSCVGQERFICAACQKRTLDKSIGAGNYLVTNVGGTNHGDSGIATGSFY